jgi:hypothetical protein
MAAESDEPMTGHALRAPAALWKRFGEVCKARGTSRSTRLRELMTTEIATYDREQRRIAFEQSVAEQRSARD